MSDTLRDDLISLLHSQLPDRPSDYFQLTTDLAQYRLWLEYDRPRLLLMLARPGVPVMTGSPEFIVQGPGGPVMLLFDTWFRDETVKALFVEPCLDQRSDILGACEVFLLRCTTAHQALDDQP